MPAPDTPRSPVADTSALAPLREPVFRMLWLAWLTANVCMWMNDVAAAWLMTSLTTSPVMVALVQSASTLPVFLLGLPSGALADILDRRRYFIVTQFWVAAVALVVCLVLLSGAMNAALLLVLTFANGIGLAMRWPVFAAIVPELVPRPQLPAALALNGIAMNASRIVGPLVAGAVIASLGSAWVFVLNAVLSVAAGFAIMRWRREAKVSALPGERFFGAMRVGLQHVRQSTRMHAVLWRISAFFLQATALQALMPLVAKGLPGGGAGTFTLLLAGLGMGAIVAALYLPRIRQRYTRDQLVHHGTLVQAGATLVVAFSPNLYVAMPAMVVAGMAWISVANSLTVAAQLSLPDWVRARGMSIYQMALMGSSAAGAALWGQVAGLTDVRTSLVGSAVFGVVALAFTRRFRIQGAAEEDLSPTRVVKPPEISEPVDPDAGPVLVTIEYRIDPAQATAFLAVMEETRRARLRQGALSWELFRDTADPGRYIEYLLDESWVEHLRRFDRFTASDAALRERRLSFHIGETSPVVTRCIAQAFQR
ncbi:MFS transporter [Aquabacterium sp. A7-Y]|uniref:MFS transporter n=1 Tax=Aquabacterium sp. A7-Y TaxID=1349605 RepID=UPI00223CC928|nr:MFS transporter [Aquabacterium sp. A7-Y]MCW7539750.1 MFS transporter [Aquabacterium sp. A7-Y]